MKKGLFSLTNLSLKKREDFDLVYRKGKKFSFSCYSVFFLRWGDIKFALSIPKRLGKAFYRNRRKRILREYFRKEIFNLPKGYYIFSLFRKPADEVSEKRELEEIFIFFKNQDKI
ncbi:MAG: ribonuclease P protein component [Brevinematales bacterium]|nr:ribonuclease P protein component [Brevinematales bacterium]